MIELKQVSFKEGNESGETYYEDCILGKCGVTSITLHESHSDPLKSNTGFKHYVEVENKDITRYYNFDSIVLK